MDLDSFFQQNPLARYMPGAATIWLSADQNSNAGGLTLFDLSGNDRDVAGGGVLSTESPLRGARSVRFNGSAAPLQSAGFSALIKQVFVVACLEPLTFSSNLEGLLSGLSTGGILVGAGAGLTRWFDLLYSADYRYRLDDVGYAANAQAAPVGGQFGISEISFPSGIAVDGFQIGQDRTFTTRRWNGAFVEVIAFPRVLTLLERERVYFYFACKYHLWRRAGALRLFPFPADRTRSASRDREHYVSTPYVGDPRVLVRGDLRRQISCTFSTRIEAEFDAAEAFHAQRYPNPEETFVIRDWRYSPARDRIVRFASPLTERGSDVSFRFNYQFDVVEP